MRIYAISTERPIMAKRYYQSKKDRMHESRGEKRHIARMVKDRIDERMGEERFLEHHRDMHNDERRNDMMRERSGAYHYDREERAHYRKMGGPEYYSGMEPRRRQEMRDAGMLHEDPRAVANLPQDVKYYPYPKAYGYLPEELDDTLRGVDRQMELDHSQTMRHFFPKKV